MRSAAPVWTPAAPPVRGDRRIVTGAVLTFVGFLIQGIVGFLSILLFRGDFGGFILFNVVSGIASILIAVGLLLAFLGIAARLR